MPEKAGPPLVDFGESHISASSSLSLKQSAYDEPLVLRSLGVR